MTIQTIDVMCPCGTTLIRLGAGANLSGVSAIECLNCGVKTPIDSDALTKQASALPFASRGGSVMVRGHAIGCLLIRGADGAKG